MAVSSKRSNIRTPYVSKDDDSKQELPSRNSLAEGKDLDDVTTFTAKGFTQSRFSNGTPLLNFLDDNSKNLPVLVNVNTSMYRNAIKSPLYEEKLTLNFEMSLYVVRGNIDRGGNYHIPLCSSHYFSILHNPTHNIQQAMLGHYYETVGHILAQPSRSRPMAVCVTRSFPGSNSESSIVEGDILLISPRIHTRTFKQGKFMKCIHVDTGEVKMLHENCIGGFTTSPDHLKMYLHMFWNHKYCPPPLKVVLYHSLPQMVLSQNTIMTLTSGEWEDSVIATHEIRSAMSESLYGNTVHTLRIQKDVGICITSHVDMMGEEIYHRTAQLYNDFELSKMDQHLFCDDPVWPNFEEVQSMFYVDVLTGHSNGIVLKKPENALRFKRQKVQKSHQKPEDECKSDYTHLPFESADDVYATLTSHAQDDDKFFHVHDGVELIPDVARLLHEVNTANRQIMIHVESLRAEVEGLKLDLKQTKSIMSMMKREMSDMVSRLESEMKGSLISTLAASQDAAGVQNENKEILKSFTSNQVLQALDLLSLSQYKNKFASKGISGLELVCYDESVLVQELDISKKADRIRLMLFINGHEAIWKLLECEGST